MICPKCKNNIPDNSEYCQICGHKIEFSSVVGNQNNPESLICPKCGSESPTDSTFCQTCGSRFHDLSGTTGVENCQKLEEPTIIGKEALVKKKQEKKKFCKLCGGGISTKNKKCLKCGKQYFLFPKFRLKKKTFLIGGVSFVILALIGLNIFQLITSQMKYKQYEAKLVENEDLIAQIRNSSQDKTKRLSELSSEVSALKRKTSFFDRYAVIAPNDGSKIYHRYDCTYLNNSVGFWIYNDWAAQSLGFKPCPYCIK